MIAVAFACAAATALAGVDHWFAGTLGQGFGYASVTNPITYIEATGNHNGFCIAKDNGAAGYGSATKTTAGPRTCSSSGGFASSTENGAANYRAWVDNSTSNDIIFDASTHYSY